MADEPDNLVLVQLRGMRREMAAILENQRRDRELITRLALRVDQGFADLRRDISEIRSDMVQLENGLLNRHTEILDVVRRLDEIGLPTQRPSE